MSQPRGSLWWSAVTLRVRSHWQFKMYGTLAYFAAFFVGYFLLLQHPVFPVTIMPSGSVDRWTGFHPWTLTFYISLWFYVQFVPALFPKKRDLIDFGWGVAGLMVAGFVFFFFWPTATPKLLIDPTVHTQVLWLKSIDASGNACPSLHVAFAIFYVAWNFRLLRELRGAAWLHIANLIWCAGIIYSTLATKQHVFWDVLAGAALGGIAVTIHLIALAVIGRRRARLDLPGPNPVAQSLNLRS